MERINEEIRKELSQILQTEMKDPRLESLISVVRTETSRDLKYCKAYVSVLGDEETRAEVKTALKSAVGFIRRELAHRLNLRVTPELIFHLDDSIEYSIHMENLLHSIELPPADQADGQGDGQ